MSDGSLPMSWNYRVLRRQVRYHGEIQDDVSVVEVYYDDSHIVSWTDPVTVGGYDDIEHLRADLVLLGRAVLRPVLIECGACKKLYETARCPIHGRNLLPAQDDHAG